MKPVFYKNVRVGTTDDGRTIRFLDTPEARGIMVKLLRGGPVSISSRVSKFGVCDGVISFDPSSTDEYSLYTDSDLIEPYVGGFRVDVVGNPAMEKGRVILMAHPSLVETFKEGLNK